jgi:hypothetical protein
MDKILEAADRDPISAELQDELRRDIRRAAVRLIATCCSLPSSKPVVVAQAGSAALAKSGGIATSRKRSVGGEAGPGGVEMRSKEMLVEFIYRMIEQPPKHLSKSKGFNRGQVVAAAATALLKLYQKGYEK